MVLEDFLNFLDYGSLGSGQFEPQGSDWPEFRVAEIHNLHFINQLQNRKTEIMLINKYKNVLHCLIFSQSCGEY